MSNDNPFNDGAMNPETIPGDMFNNLISRKRAQIGDQVYVLHETSSQADNDGTIIDDHTIYLHTDRAGNPLPQDPSQASISHSGIIAMPENTAICTSPLHWGNRSRTIAIGHDGHLTTSGAICSQCNGWRLTLSLAVFIVTTGVFIGLLIGILNL